MSFKQNQKVINNFIYNPESSKTAQNAHLGWLQRIQKEKSGFTQSVVRGFHISPKNLKETITTIKQKHRGTISETLRNDSMEDQSSVDRKKTVQLKNRLKYQYKKFLKNRYIQAQEAINNSAERYKVATLDMSLPEINYSDKKKGIFKQKQSLNGVDAAYSRMTLLNKEGLIKNDSLVRDQNKTTLNQDMIPQDINSQPKILVDDIIDYKRNLNLSNETYVVPHRQKRLFTNRNMRDDQIYQTISPVSNDSKLNERTRDKLDEINSVYGLSQFQQKQVIKKQQEITQIIKEKQEKLQNLNRLNRSRASTNSSIQRELIHRNLIINANSKLS
ncbi:UNKNOWN [Stylonychia lemnae]|uniref:Uncharacterized protein n=1 Tax=Stylonychia lemnae TaxID=5949 RepID=A0A078BAV6_STYLE|nr:UNKNOWN [Stylonychia lemnae]|eukprot:CDW91514.1 UNKNOWN [Stylonychia lemnae]